MTRPPAASPAATPVRRRTGPPRRRACRRRSTTTTSDARARRRPACRPPGRRARPGPAARPGVRFHAGDLEPGPAQVGGHRRPHRAQPDEPDPLHARPSCSAPSVPRRARRQIRCGDGVAGRRAAADWARALLVVRAHRDDPGRDRRRGPHRGRRSPRATSTTGSRPTRRGSADSLHRITTSMAQTGHDHRQRRRDPEHDERAIDDAGDVLEDLSPSVSDELASIARLQHPRLAAARRRGRHAVRRVRRVDAADVPGEGRRAGRPTSASTPTTLTRARRPRSSRSARTEVARSSRGSTSFEVTGRARHPARRRDPAAAACSSPGSRSRARAARGSATGCAARQRDRGGRAAEHAADPGPR